MANETSKSKRKDIRFPHELIEKIDEQSQKENTNFSAWVISACREKLTKPNKK